MNGPASRIPVLALALLGGVGCTSPTSTIEPPPVPAAVVIEEGASLVATVGDALTLTALVTTVEHRPVPNSPVSFQITSGDGSLVAVSATTDLAGKATARWQLGTRPGSNSLTATVAGLPAVGVTVELVAAAPVGLAIRTQPVMTQVGKELTVSPVVALVDRYGNTVSNVPATITTEVLGGGSVLRGSTSVPLVAGLASFTGLALSGPIGERRLRFAVAGFPAVESAASTLLPLERSTVDRQDDLAGSQVHLYYVLPSDGADRSYDILPVLTWSATIFQRFLASRMAGRAFRIDSYQGAFDISFFRLSLTDAQMQAFGSNVVTEIERQLRAAGAIAPTKKYAVYYDGGSTYSCGGAAWPPYVSGVVAAMYLRAAGCPTSLTASSPLGAMGYWESAMLHDLVHTFGVVSKDAPHHTTLYPAHVPERDDLMYSGPEGWNLGNSMVLDVDNDDYFGSRVSIGMASLNDSPFLTELPLASSLVAALQEIQGAQNRRVERVLLPMHPSFPLPPWR